MKLNIGIIGSGSAAAVCASTILNIFKTYKGKIIYSDIELSIISNPNIPKMSVGESLSPGLFTNLTEILEIQNIKDYEELEISLRVGARHRWEKNENDMFDIEYSRLYDRKPGKPFEHKNYRYAAHLSSKKFSEFVFKRLKELFDNKLLEIHDNVKNIYQNERNVQVYGENNIYSFDYLFDCRGFPTKEEFDSGKYNFMKYETVNSVLLFQREEIYNHPYTEVLFHKNGWQFGINTAKRKAFGYLYNKDITDKEDAIKHFQELNKDFVIDNVKEFYWPSYTAKKPVDGRIICMGNKLYFFEPIQGIPLHNYGDFTSKVMLKIFNMFDPNDISLYDSKLPLMPFINNNYYDSFERFQDLVHINYVGNSINSEFWKITQENSIKHLLESEQWMNFCEKYVKGDKPDFKPHSFNIIEQYIKGLNVKPENFINGVYKLPK